VLDITSRIKTKGIEELVNRIQNIRKDSGFEVTDKISAFEKKWDLNNKKMKLY
jgi:isoleucyl-tRNA synthetase